MTFPKPPRPPAAAAAAIAAAAALAGCGGGGGDPVGGADFDAWYPQYNRYITNWLNEERGKTQKLLDEADAKIAEAADPEVEANLRLGRDEHVRTLEQLEARLARGDYFQFKTEADLPGGLVWEDGSDQPEVGDPACKKGGAFRYYIPSFPPTIRPFGPEANNSFRGELYDNIEIALIDLHPETGAIIPGVAEEWARDPDGKTVYFRLDPDAAYNDGVKVEVIDFLWWVYIRASDNVSAPWHKQYLREQFAGFTLYGDEVIGVTLPVAKVKLPYYCGIYPAAKHFYADYGPDYEERYQWRVPPTTAAYTVAEGGLVKGASITLSRDEDWWAKDKKFWRYRFNADRLVYSVVRDSSKAWELFRAGQLDYFPVTLPEYWYEKSEMPPVFDGYVERYTWYNQYPRVPWSLYLNTAKPPLDELDVRLGINHAINWQKVIDVVFRGDAERLPSWVKGYGAPDSPDVVPRPFSIAKAREHFAAAGFDKEGADGILVHADGRRMEVILSYGTHPVREKMMAIIKEEARKAGLDVILDSTDPMQAFLKATKKEHQMAFMGWGFQPPYPRFYEYFHSSNAYDEQGNIKVDTNNIFSFRDERMDKLALSFRFATDEDELVRLSHEMQRIIHDSGVYIPGYMTEFARVATWRWVRWPDCEFTEFAPPMKYIPMESYVYWIDEDIKAETEAAMRAGETFPEVQAVKQRYRTTGVTAAAAPEKGGGE